MVQEQDILSLGMRADEARRRGPTASTVWYQRVHVLQAREAIAAEIAVPDAATEVRVLDTPATFEEALAIVRRLNATAHGRMVTAFSASDLAERSETGWGGLAGILGSLAAAGLSDFAELPVDEVPDLGALIRSARGAGLQARRLTVAHAVADRRTEILQQIKHCVDVVGGIARVSPLPHHVPHDKPTTGYEDVRMIALTRLALSEARPAPPVFVEVDWSLYGPKLAQVALTFGADFLDAVSATTDESLGRRRGTVQDVERNIRAAGFEPREYRPL